MIAFLMGPLGKIAGIVALCVATFLGFKIWLHGHDAAILEGYVLKSEKIAAEARADEIQRQSVAASQALSEAEKRRAAAELNDAASKVITDKQVKDYETKLEALNRQCKLDNSDYDFLMHH